MDNLGSIMTSASLTPAVPAGRVSRRPAHHFSLKTRPWQIQPAFIAPVLPGETCKNILLQSRVVSAALNSAMTGWWSEFYIFYVKLRDLNGRDDFTQMILTPSFDLSDYDDAADAKTYHAGPGVNWTQLCLERVVEEYFRDEGETWDEATLDGIPLASINGNSWLDSVRLDAASAETNDHELPGENPTLPAYMAGWENHYAQWESMRALKLTEATFEDWLRSFGVRAPRDVAETHRPELIRYVRDWSFPAPSVASDGTPAHVAAWNHAERADKDRFFKEPGFIFGVHVCRPKVYLSGQAGSAIGMLNDAFSFLPAVMAAEAYTSLRLFTSDDGGNTPDGPLAGGPSGSYWVDIKDLFLYGDQFANYDLSAATDVAKVALPAATLQRRFASGTDADALFSTATKVIRQDGIATFNILGRQVETT